MNEHSLQQKEIIESKSKNILVVACPGSGKTHTVVSRYIHLVTVEKVNPNSIILITFTNKAGIEMSQRIKNIIPDKMPYYVGSCHGLGYNMLKKFKPIEQNYTVMDRIDMEKLLKEITQNMLEKTEDYTHSIIYKKIITIYDILYTNYPIDLDITLAKLAISDKYKKSIDKIIKKYNKEKEEQFLVDFNDLMYKLCIILENKKTNKFLKGIQYIFFDEYQDINPIQHYILKMFKYSNKMVVGDDAQAIYSFRGSSIQYIWDFEKQFEDVKTYYLEMNYRSTPEIVNLFQDSIKNNSNQFKKNVVSNSINNNKPKIICSINQYNMVATNIHKYFTKGEKLCDMVVLARTNKSLDMIELELIKLGIPTIKSNGINLLNKDYIKDFIALLIIGVNNQATFYWKHVFNMHNIIQTDTIEYNILGIKNIIPILYNLLIDEPSINNIKQINNIKNYILNFWNEKNVEKMNERIEDINNIISYINEKTNTIPYEEFIISLYLDSNLENKIIDILSLSTIHSCKGLEWERVYIIDYNGESKFKNDIMEERRLFYVACSRAKKHLIITSDNKSISPFIRELNPLLYEGSPTTLKLLTL